MGGFKNKVINIAFNNGVINIIIAHLIKCSKHMKADCIKNNNPLENNEDRITDRLVAEYLNAKPNDFRYELQSPENFDKDTKRYVGRTDIRVISWDYFKISSKAYFIIECKRIDGTNRLNREYITEGVIRFVNYPPKYSSYYDKNIMFAYVIKAINVHNNAEQISELQRGILTDINSTIFEQCQNDVDYYVYSCEYTSKTNYQIKLYHLFYDLASVIIT